ncbi:MAG TPA: hypothetical protein VK891_00175 [Euzebyales bacterium]|nr:hypothetical protein [Euzebyales bacterium]
MTYTDRRPPPGRHRGPARRRRGGGGGWVALLVLLVVLAALAWLLLGGGFAQLAGTDGDPSEADIAEPVDVSLDELVDRAERNDDGSVTVTVSEAEAGGLMREALSRGDAPTLRDVRVDLQDPAGSAPGQMEVRGRLPDQDLPVTAVVDLRVADGAVAPRLRDVRVGPIPVPAGLAEDLNQEFQQVSLLADRGITVDDLATSDDEMVVTGRRE